MYAVAAVVCLLATLHVGLRKNSDRIFIEFHQRCIFRQGRTDPLWIMKIRNLEEQWNSGD